MVCALLVPSGAIAEPPPAERLKEADAEFRQQRYRSAAELLRPLLYPTPQLKSPDDLVTVRELLGAAYWHLKELPKAEREWQFLLTARPAHELEEFLHPDPLEKAFEKLRRILIEQKVIAKVVPTDKRPPPTVLRIVEIKERRSRAMTFVPFGVPQFEYGADGWGWFFATSQGLSAATSLGSFMALTLLRYQTPEGFTRGSDEQKRDTALVLTAVISGAVFYGLATWGIIDANVRYEPEKLLSRTETEVDQKTVDLRAPQPQRTVQQPGGSR